MVGMKVLLIGRDFDFSAGDGISRYSYELSRGLERHADVETISTGTMPRPMRVLFRNTIKARGVDVVHLMYPDVAMVKKESAKMAVTWHDLRPFEKYTSKGQARYNPAFFERFNGANAVIRRWLAHNYSTTDAIICNSSQTLKEVKDKFSASSPAVGKKYFVTPLGVEPVFLKTKVWKGERKDFAYIGSIHLKHKNLKGLLKAFEKICGSTDSMLHIYTSSPNAEEVLDEGLMGVGGLPKDRVLLHVRSSDEEISRHLPKLAAYLQLTRHEGLGVPILEALACGTNVITLSGSNIPEETRRYSIRVDEKDVAKTMLSLAKSPRPAPQSAIKYARGFTWERTVRETLSAYRQILK